MECEWNASEMQKDAVEGGGIKGDYGRFTACF